MNSGIYKILNKVNGKFYIGSAIDLLRRWKKHKYELNTKTHINQYLQNAWNKYWDISFSFEVLEYCKKEHLIEREQYWLDLTKCYDPEIGYNILKLAQSTLGSKHSDETKARMSAWQIGRIMSDEAKEKMSYAQRNPNKWPHILGIKCKCDECSAKMREYKKLKAREYRKDVTIWN